MSEYVFNHKENFNVFIPTILNTPIGIILRHNWSKNKAMYDDPNKIIGYMKEEYITEDLKAYLYRLIIWIQNPILIDNYKLSYCVHISNSNNRHD